MAQGDIFAGISGGFDLPDLPDLNLGIGELHRMIEPLLGQIAKSVENIKVDVKELTQNIAKTISGQVQPKEPPDKPGKNVFFPDSKLGNLFSQGHNIGGGLLGNVQSGLNLAGSVAAKAGESIPQLATLAGPLAPVAGAAVVAAGALAGLTAASISLTRSFAEFSPQLTAVFTQSQVRGIIRSQQIGSLTAGSTDDLLRAVDKLKDNLAPLLAGLINGVNRVIAPAIDAIGSLADIIVNLNFTMDNILDVLSLMNPALFAIRALLGDDDKKNQSLIINDLVRQLQFGPINQRPQRRLD